MQGATAPKYRGVTARDFLQTIGHFEENPEVEDLLIKRLSQL